MEVLLRWKGENITSISPIPLYIAVLNQDFTEQEDVFEGNIRNDKEHGSKNRLRFNSEEAYFNHFQPLIIQDTCASIHRQITSCGTGIDQEALTLTIPDVLCVAIQTYTQQKDIGRDSNDHYPAMDRSRLVEAWIQLPIDKKKLKFEIAKDDLIVLTKSVSTQSETTTVGTIRNRRPIDLIRAQRNNCDICVVLSKPTINHRYNKQGGPSSALYICMYVYMYVCMYVCMYLCVCKHTYGNDEPF